MVSLEKFFREETMTQKILGSNNHKRMVGTMPGFIGALTLFFFCCIFAASAWAGDGMHRHDPQKQLNRLTERLGLTDAQQAMIKPILEQKAQKIQALREQMKEARHIARGQIEAELTSDQLQTYKQLLEERKKRRENRRGRGGKRHN